MTERHNIPGPGEYADPVYLQAEAYIGPIPDGEMLSVDPVRDRRRSSYDTTAIEPREPARAAEIREHRSDRSAPLGVRPRADFSEQRLDQCAATQDREQALDSVRDDAGPQSDMC